MKGKLCLITGATAGIGKATAQGLARLGAEVVIVSRYLEKCEEVVAAIQRETGNPNVDYICADLSSQKEIRRAVDVFNQKFSRLNVLVNNIGVMNLRRHETVDGIERTFAVNHLGYFLLTNLLLDAVIASAPARIVNVSSNSHYDSSLDFDDLQLNRRYQGVKAYGLSKMANVLFTYELSRQLDGTGVTANALHPGFVRTDIGKDNGLLVRIFQPLVTLRGLSLEEGAETSIYLASSPEVEGVSGKFYSECQPVDSDPDSYDVTSQKRLWDISKELVGL